MGNFPEMISSHELSVLVHNEIDPKYQEIKHHFRATSLEKTCRNTISVAISKKARKIQTLDRLRTKLPLKIVEEIYSDCIIKIFVLELEGGISIQHLCMAMEKGFTLGQIFKTEFKRRFWYLFDFSKTNREIVNVIHIFLMNKEN